MHFLFQTVEGDKCTWDKKIFYLHSPPVPLPVLQYMPGLYYEYQKNMENSQWNNINIWHRLSIVVHVFCWTSLFFETVLYKNDFLKLLWGILKIKKDRIWNLLQNINVYNHCWSKKWISLLEFSKYDGENKGPCV